MQFLFRGFRRPGRGRVEAVNVRNQGIDQLGYPASGINAFAQDAIAGDICRRRMAVRGNIRMEPAVDFPAVARNLADADFEVFEFQSH